MTRYAQRLGIASFFVITQITAYLDNKYLFPINRHLTILPTQRRSLAQVGIFFMTADSARNCNGETVFLPALEGCYDLAKINTAMQSVGLSNPYYLSDWTRSEIPFQNFGKLRGTGIDWSLEYAFSTHWSAGAAFTFLHCSTRYNYRLTNQTKENLAIISGNNYYPGRERSFEQARLGVNQTLNLQAGQWSGSGMGDTELFIRFDTRDEYWWKLKQIDLNLILGCIAPTGKCYQLYQPASIPFGGNGHWGIYAQATMWSEITDDWFFGLDVFGIQRLAKTQKHRMPVASEPFPYGVVVDYARVTPGFLIGFSPYLFADDLYDGFGIYVAYTYAHHCCDWWRYNGSYSPNLTRLNQAGYWTNEFFTLGLDFDLAKRPNADKYGPRFYFDWTLPTNIFGASSVAKTHRVGLGIEFHF